MTPQPVGVRLEGVESIRFCEAVDGALQPGQVVVVEDRCQRLLGTVVIAPPQLLATEVPLPLSGRARPASAADIARLGPTRSTAGRRLWESLDPPVPPSR